MDELWTILAGRTFCGWMGVPVLGVKWESSCEGVSVNGDLVVVPLVLTGVGHGGSLLDWVLGASVGSFR